jgi:hypothetical protein
MGVGELLSDLRRRGVSIQVRGEHIAVEPASRLTEADRKAIRSHKEALLAELEDLARSDLLGAPIEGVREQVGAVLVRSPCYGEIWLALDACVVGEIAAEESSQARPRPVLLVGDVARLRGKPEAMIRAALEVARAFPGARVVS